MNITPWCNGSRYPSRDNSAIYVPSRCEEEVFSEDIIGEDLRFPPYIRTTVTLLCAIILLVGTVGNVLVPVVVCRTKELRNSTNIFLINLSIADLLVLLVCMPPVLIELNSRPEVWPLGHGMCKIVPYLELTVAHGSILTILAISFERYYAICKPLKAGYTCTKMRAVAIILGVWLLASSSACPLLVITEYTFVQYIDGGIVPVCVTDIHEVWEKVYFVLVNVVFFWLPLGVLLVVYGIITKQLMVDRRVLNSATERSQMKARKQVVMMLCAVMVCFFLCLMPFRLFAMWVSFRSLEEVRALGMELYYNVLYFCRVMLYINSAVNPVLYNLISSKFRHAFVCLLWWHSPIHLVRTTSTTTTTTSCTAITLKGSLKSRLSLSLSFPSHHTASFKANAKRCCGGSFV